MIATLIALLLCALLAIASCGIGLLAMPRLRRSLAGLERIVFATAMGMGILGLLVLLLGLLRLLSSPFLTGLLAVSVLAGGTALLTLGRTGESSAVAKTARPRWFITGVVAVALLGLLSLIGALAPPGGNEWDSLAHQLAVPKLYLAEGRVYYIPWVSHSNFPYLLQMLFTWMLGLGSVGAAKLCHWLCGALLVLSVYTFAVRHYRASGRGPAIGLLAALFLASTPIVFWEASVAYIDLATALFTWLSLYALINAAQAVGLPEEDEPIAADVKPTLTPPAPLSRKQKRGEKVSTRRAVAEVEAPRAAPPPGEADGEGDGANETYANGASVSWLILSAALMGFALGTKLTVLGFWGIMLVGILGWHVARTGRWAKETLPHGAIWAAVSLVLAAPWYVKSWLYTGNPVYPFYYSLFGGRYWNAANAATYATDQAKFGLEKTAPNLLLSPWYVTLGGREFTEYVAFGLSPVYLALLFGAPLLARRLSRAAVTLLLFGLGSYVFWFFMMQQTRYLIPALPAFAIVAAEVLVRVGEELKAARWAGGALTACAVAWGLYLATVGIAGPALPVVTGQTDRWEYVARTLPGVAPAIRFINESTPADSKVALFDEVRGFYLERPYLWATPNHSTLLPWDDYRNVDDWLSDFRRRGYTTLLVNEAAAPKTDDNQRWRDLLPEAVAQGKLTRAFSDSGVVVYRIP